MSGVWAEAGTATIKAMVRAAHSGYLQYKNGACSCAGKGEKQGWRNMRERDIDRDRESRIGKDEGRETGITRRPREDHTEI